MQIATARKQAAKVIEGRVLRSMSRRPAKGQRVYARVNGKLFLAENEQELQEKVAKNLQYQARKSTKH